LIEVQSRATPQAKAMAKVHTFILFVFVGLLAFDGSCAEDKPAIVEIARFFFKLGRQFVPPPCKPASSAPAAAAAPPAAAPPAALAEPDNIENDDDDDDKEEEEKKEGLALFEPSPAPDAKAVPAADDKKDGEEASSVAPESSAAPALNDAPETTEASPEE
jgi:hypothetical protein